MACSVGSKVQSKNDHMVNENFEKISMISGTAEIDIWIDETVLVGIVSTDSASESRYNELLSKTDLVWYEPPVRGIPLPTYGEPISVIFKMLKRKDGEKISQENCESLQLLRETYSENFGPGIFYESGETWGVLSNVITVGFKYGTSEAFIQKQLKSLGATRIMSTDPPEHYRVEFPKDWGYKIIDVGKDLFKLDEVNFVENQFQVIDSFD